MSESLLKRVLLLAALAAQVPHAAGLFYMISPESGGGWWDVLQMVLAFLYALALEGAVYYFVLRAHKLYSWGFAVASILSNLLYYWPNSGPEVYMARMALVSVMLPIAIALYSHDNVEQNALTVEQGWQELEAEDVPHLTNQSVEPEAQPVAGVLSAWLTESPSPSKTTNRKRNTGNPTTADLVSAHLMSFPDAKPADVAAALGIPNSGSLRAAISNARNRRQLAPLGGD